MMSHNYDVASRNAKSKTTKSEKDHYTHGDHGKLVCAWSQSPRSLCDILQEAQLPVIVKEAATRRLHARNVRSRPAVRDVGQAGFKVVGPPISIPQDFQGFFKLVDTKDEPLSGVAEVSRLMSKSFISTHPCEGYVCVVQLKDTLYQKATLSPGLYHSKSIFEGNITYINKRKTEKIKLLRCLTCEDDKGKTVLFPMETKGSFYISELNSKFSRHFNIGAACRVYKWTEFEPDKVRGLIVKMLYGSVPQQDCQFTGCVQFDHVSEEHTIIGVTMTPSPRLFEMAVTAEPFFVLCLNSHELESQPIVQRCLKFAKSESQTYMQSIKVKKEYNVDQIQSQV